MKVAHRKLVAGTRCTWSLGSGATNDSADYDDEVELEADGQNWYPQVEPSEIKVNKDELEEETEMGNRRKRGITCSPQVALLNRRQNVIALDAN